MFWLPKIKIIVNGGKSLQYVLKREKEKKRERRETIDLLPRFCGCFVRSVEPARTKNISREINWREKQLRTKREGGKNERSIVIKERGETMKVG